MHGCVNACVCFCVIKLVMLAWRITERSLRGEAEAKALRRRNFSWECPRRGLRERDVCWRLYLHFSYTYGRLWWFVSFVCLASFTSCQFCILIFLFSYLFVCLAFRITPFWYIFIDLCVGLHDTWKHIYNVNERGIYHLHDDLITLPCLLVLL